MSLKNSNDTIGNRARDLETCSAVSLKKRRRRKKKRDRRSTACFSVEGKRTRVHVALSSGIFLTAVAFGTATKRNVLAASHGQ